MSYREEEQEMNTPRLETQRLILRRFEEEDIGALFLLLKDKEVNTFLPWFPAKSTEETWDFYNNRVAVQYKKEQGCFYAICLKEDNVPLGYIKAEADDSHDFGYALRKEFCHRGIVTEAGEAVVEQLKKEGLPYITATHDRNNPRSGGVMRRLGMRYQYSYEEQWQPKNFPVVFRMYQLTFDGEASWVYRNFWDLYAVPFFEEIDSPYTVCCKT